MAGVGASAGGVRAIEEFFSEMPQGSKIAFVILQHMAPGHRSVLDALIRRKTEITVEEAQEKARLQADHVYVVQSGRDVDFRDGCFHFEASGEERGSRMPIDHLFRSLAAEFGDRAIAVILSGAGSDGTLGLKEIKGEGGVVMVQDPDEAEYASMPSSAVATALADMVLPVRRMAEELLRYVDHPAAGATPAAERETNERKFEKNVQRIIQIVRAKTGHNFVHYKQNTIRRRIQRRIAVHQLPDIEEYVKFLRQNPDEVQALFRDLLINVTSFFRDPEAWVALQEDVVTPIVRDRDPEEPIRVWVPGCATGEEAYSVAILFAEAMDRLERQIPIKIFATDISPEGIDAARDGCYPPNIAADLTPARLKEYFVKKEEQYRVVNRIREMVVFAVHDLTRDPPFSQLDLITCRNLLIYMDQDLQKTILPVFHYSLARGGCLFLGTSEGVGDFLQMYAPVDKRWKIYRVEPVSSERHIEEFRQAILGLEPPRLRRVIAMADREKPREKETRSGDREDRPAPPAPVDAREVLRRTMMDRYAPPAVLLDHDFNVLYFHGETDKFLRPPQGEPAFNLLAMARDSLLYRLTVALREARSEGKPVRCEQIPVRRTDGRFFNADLTISPLERQRGGPRLLLVTFEEHPGPDDEEARQADRDRESDARHQDLQDQLNSTRQDLQATIEELETSNEELKSANEELQANNEELQSANEELEASREELQSANEELETVNTELHRRNEALTEAHDDINNFFGATDIATLILDTRLRIKRFTPATKRIFNLIDADHGRVITDLTSQLIDVDLLDQARDVIDTLDKKELEVRTRDGGCYQLRILPYRTADNVIEGVVLTFQNISEVKRVQERARDAQRYAESVIATVREPLVVLDDSLRVVSANNAFFREFGLDPQRTSGKHVYELDDRQWAGDQLRHLLEKIVPQNEEFNDFRVEHRFPDGQTKIMLLNARRIQRQTERGQLILLAIEIVPKEGQE